MSNDLQWNGGMIISN